MFKAETTPLELILRVRDISRQGCILWTAMSYGCYFFAIIFPTIATGVGLHALVFRAATSITIFWMGAFCLGEVVVVATIAWLDPRAVAGRYDKAFTFFAWLARVYHVIDQDNPETLRQVKYCLHRGIHLTQSSEALALFDGIFGSGVPEAPVAMTGRDGQQLTPPAEKP